MIEIAQQAEVRRRQRFSDLRFGTLALKDTKLSFVAGVIPSANESFFTTILLGAAIPGEIDDIATNAREDRREVISDLVMRIKQAQALGDTSGYREFEHEVPEYLRPIAYVSETGHATVMHKGLTDKTAESLDADRVLIGAVGHLSQAFLEECRFADENGYYRSPNGL